MTDYELMIDVFKAFEDARSDPGLLYLTDEDYACCVRVPGGILMSRVGERDPTVFAIAFHADDDHPDDVTDYWWNSEDVKEPSLHGGDTVYYIRGGDAPLEKIASLLNLGDPQAPPLKWQMIIMAGLDNWAISGAYSIAELLPDDDGDGPAPTETPAPRPPRLRRMRA